MQPPFVGTLSCWRLIAICFAWKCNAIFFHSARDSSRCLNTCQRATLTWRHVLCTADIINERLVIYAQWREADEWGSACYFSDTLANNVALNSRQIHCKFCSSDCSDLAKSLGSTEMWGNQWRLSWWISTSRDFYLVCAKPLSAATIGFQLVEIHWISMEFKLVARTLQQSEIGTADAAQLCHQSMTLETHWNRVFETNGQRFAKNGMSAVPVFAAERVTRSTSHPIGSASKDLWWNF